VLGWLQTQKESPCQVAIEINFKLRLLEQYDRSVESMGLTSGNLPPEAISTWSRRDPTMESASVDVVGVEIGIRPVLAGASRPLLAPSGITDRPETTYRDVHIHLPHSCPRPLTKSHHLSRGAASRPFDLLLELADLAA